MNSIVLSQNCEGCASSCASQTKEVLADEFEEVSEDEFTTGEDEFLNESDSDEFSQEGDEFAEDDINSELTTENKSNIFTTPLAKKTYILLLLTIVAGFLVRYKKTRGLRPVFLVGGMVWLGFYSGGCPCMISSFQNFLLLFIGEGQVSIDALFWIIGLIPITYLFGRVWCGWLCHLGALQEFLYLPQKYGIWQSAKAQRVLKYTRYFFFVALIGQILITQSNLFIEIDPFKVAFNLYSANTTGYVLLVILLLLSLFSYRPFCRGMCPVGTLLGWIEKLPFASILTINSKCNEEKGGLGVCNGCCACNKACKSQAITKVDTALYMDNEECIMCGECMDSCKQSGINITKNKSKQSKTKFFERVRKNGK
jgi:polyferredoxin